MPTPAPDAPSRRRVVFVVFDGLQSLDLTGPWEALNAAGAEDPEGSTRSTGIGRSYDLVTASASGPGVPVTSSSGLRIWVDAAAAEIEALDTLVVVGGAGTRDALVADDLTAEIARLSGLARRTCSVCSGAFLLARAGLLDGKKAVTHWAWCDLLAELYPEVEVDPDPIWVRDGDVYTSAGVTSGIDLALALIEEDLGPAAALAVARQLVVYGRRPGGQSQFSVQLAHDAAAPASPVRRLQDWIAENLDDDLSVGSLAAQLHVSERHLGRLFRDELGASPADYVEQARVERARQLLERGGRSAAVDTVAAHCGFASAEVMRRAFHRRLGVSPREYRDRFQISPTT